MPHVIEQKGPYEDILAKFLSFQDNFKFQDNSEISSQLGPLCTALFAWS